MDAKRPKLAPRVYWKNGAYRYVTRERKWITLGRTEHEAYEALAELKAPSRNMLALLERYEREILPKKAAETQAGQKRQLTALKLTFGHMEPAKVKPSHIAAFHDEMGQVAPVSANRHVALLSAVFKFALRIGAVELNPCRGIGRHAEKPRGRYVTDEEYSEVYPYAPAWLQVFMDMERLTGQREGNLIRLLLPAVKDKDCVSFPAQKGGKAIEVEWSAELGGVIDRAKARRAEFAKERVVSLNLLLGHRGSPITRSGLQSGMRRLWAAYERANAGKSKDSLVPHFTLHDLRAKAGSDTGNSKMLGHKNPAVFHRVYDRKPVRVKPAK